MILDDNLVFLDGASLSEAVTSEPVALNALLRPGAGHDAIPMLMAVTEEAEGGESLEIKLREADSADGDYGDVPGACFSVPAAGLTAGARIGWRHLPHAVTKSWLRLTLTPSGSFSAGKIFAALTREDPRPYSGGMYVNAGRVVG